jgi:tetratricopeptide (TPR) repeat protein
MSIDAMFQQANAAQMAGNFAEAERRYRALARAKPLWAYHNLGVLYAKTQRFKEAEIAFRTALKVDPTCASPRHSLGMLLLGAGDYSAGWPLMEARYELPNPLTIRPNLSFPEWRGEDLAGKHILLVLEQGLGDQIQFARFIPQLQTRGAKVSYACSPSLVRLLRPLGDMTPIPGGNIPKADCWSQIFSLPQQLNLTVETIPGAPYVPRPSVPATGGVGVVVRGSAGHTNDRFRSLPPEAAKQILALGRSLAPEDTGAQDFQDTAEIIAGLDLVISVDTAVAHLAGAMGKPVWILLPAVETDWRWLRGRTDSPWYPSARLYRQTTPGKWGTIVRKVTEDVRALGLAA